MILSDRNTCN